MPGRRMRVVCYDGERAAALDLSHARRKSRWGRTPRTSTARQLAGGQGSGDRHDSVFREVAKGERQFLAFENAKRSGRPNPPLLTPTRRRRQGDRVHKLRHLLSRLRLGTPGSILLGLSGPPPPLILT